MGEVRIGADTDLRDEECRQLLKEFMPEHVKRRKISQKLYLKLAIIVVIIASL